MRYIGRCCQRSISELLQVKSNVRDAENLLQSSLKVLLNESKFLADRGAARPSREWGRDAFKLEFSHGKVSRMVTLLLKLSDASTVRGIRSQGTCNFTLGDKIYYLN